MVAALLSTILFSVSVVCGHRSAKLIGGVEANFWRLTSATFFLALWAYGFGQGTTGDAFPMFLLSGILGIGVGDTALFQALPRLGSRMSVLLIQCLGAPLAALIEWSWLGTTLEAGQMACIVAILLGVGLALTPGAHLNLSRRMLLVGTVWSLVGALGGALGAVLSRKAYAIAHGCHQPIDGATAAFQRILGGLFLAALFLLVAKRLAFRLQLTSSPSPMAIEPTRKWRRVWPWILANSLAGQTLGVSCMQRALETTPTGVVLAIIATTPILVIPFARFFEGERPTAKSLAGGAIAVTAVIALTLSRH